MNEYSEINKRYMNCYKALVSYPKWTIDEKIERFDKLFEELCKLTSDISHRKTLNRRKERILLVTGSKTITDKDLVWRALDRTWQKFNFNKIITDGAEGVNSLALQYAYYHSLESKAYYPEWGKYGGNAVLIRNNEMVEICTRGVAIWDGKSKDSEHCIEELRKAGKLLEVFV